MVGGVMLCSSGHVHRIYGTSDDGGAFISVTPESIGLEQGEAYRMTRLGGPLDAIMLSNMLTDAIRALAGARHAGEA